MEDVAATVASDAPAQDQDEEKCWYPWCPNWKIFTLKFSLTVGDIGTDIRTCWIHFLVLLYNLSKI